MNYKVPAIQKKFITSLLLLSKNKKLIDDFFLAKHYSYIVNDKAYWVNDGKYSKVVIGPDYNFFFSKIDGSFYRWGKTLDDDPEYSPIGPEIADIEITTKCSGSLKLNTKGKSKGKLTRTPCSFCYKSNTPNGTNMSFETFKSIIEKLPKTLTQVAYGADSTATSNPDLWKMAEYCREIGIVPNITVADVPDEIADKLAAVMGAVAVSRYEYKDACYDTVQKLVARGMKQVNIHYMIAQETYDGCIETINDMTTDKRLKGMNALVMLSLKKKGRGTSFTSLTQDQYSSLVNLCLEKGIKFGFDSCGCKKFFDAVKNDPNYKSFKEVGEPCESTCFSWYLDVNGMCYPCSFCEKAKGWENGIDVTKVNDFLSEIWNNCRIKEFRKAITSNIHNEHGARECIIYDI